MEFTVNKIEKVEKCSLKKNRMHMRFDMSIAVNCEIKSFENNHHEKQHVDGGKNRA